MWGVSTDTRWGCSAAWVTAAASNDSITKIFLIIISFLVIVRRYILIVFTDILILFTYIQIVFTDMLIVFTDIQIVFTDILIRYGPSAHRICDQGCHRGRAQGPNFLQS